MHTRWRWVLFGLGIAVAALGPLAAREGPWYAYVVGGLWFLMGATVAWRTVGLGTKLTDEGITSHGIDRQTDIAWCDVEAVEPKRSRNLIFFHTIAPEARLRRGKHVLTELSLLSVKKDSVPERTARHVTELQQALKAHRAGCSLCGAQPKPLAAGQSIVGRLRARLRALLR
ncbi:hypothetical protein [Lentzea sp. NBRC 102530]|uniref:hypothetical protein n=1 Tax=Lentzea sp. NBRC 102530 TaxID=3032201 RepID=UPI0024A2D557|nr:hypothetical protein [Lentzea sp. NBRC 102530]GLY53526.1 hypothetical protein Lesp01_71820 [Lentzea sp. NBRC 102530]